MSTVFKWECHTHHFHIIMSFASNFETMTRLRGSFGSVGDRQVLLEGCVDKEFMIFFKASSELKLVRYRRRLKFWRNKIRVYRLPILVAWILAEDLSVSQTIAIGLCGKAPSTWQESCLYRTFAKVRTPVFLFLWVPESKFGSIWSLAKF